MKRFFTLIVFLSILFQGKSQNLDLIVLSNNDSIACIIDSVTVSNIYFKLKLNDNWVKTNTKRDDVLEYKYQAIDKKDFLFKTGTSYILSRRLIGSANRIRRNAVYIELGGVGIFGSVNYDRTFPISNRSGVALGFSLGFLVDFVFDASYLYGKSNHYFELGAGYSLPVHLIIPRIGYRYQGNKGFLFRAGVMYFQTIKSESFGDFPWAGVSFGYSF